MAIKRGCLDRVRHLCVFLSASCYETVFHHESPGHPAWCELLEERPPHQLLQPFSFHCGVHTHLHKDRVGIYPTVLVLL